jgi:hypothetical protein
MVRALQEIEGKAANATGLPIRRSAAAQSLYWPAPAGVYSHAMKILIHAHFGAESNSWWAEADIDTMRW